MKLSVNKGTAVGLVVILIVVMSYVYQFIFGASAESLILSGILVALVIIFYVLRDIRDYLYKQIKEQQKENS